MIQTVTHLKILRTGMIHRTLTKQRQQRLESKVQGAAVG